MQGCFRRIVTPEYSAAHATHYNDQPLEATAFAMFAAGRKKGAGSARTLEDYCKKNADERGITRYLLSHENLLGTMLGLQRGLYPQSSVFAERVASLRDAQVKCIAFVRRQDSFIESTYKFRVKRGLEMSMAEYLQFIDRNALSWTRVFQPLREAGIDLRLYPYEFLSQPGYEHHLHSIFAEALPATTSQDFLLRRSNESGSDFPRFFARDYQAVTPLEPRFLRQMERDYQHALAQGWPPERLAALIGTRLQRAKLQCPENLEALVQRLWQEAHTPPAGRAHHSLLTNDERQGLLSYYAADNTLLFNEYLSDTFGVRW